MIIGAITEVTNQPTGVVNRELNGASLISFYTMEQAIMWARLQSEQTISGTAGNETYCLTTIINTNTEVKRWWFNGVEYTG